MCNSLTVCKDPGKKKILAADEWGGGRRKIDR